MFARRSGCIVAGTDLFGRIEQLQHGGRYDDWLLPRQEVSRACHDLAANTCGKQRALGGRIRRRTSDAIVSPIQHD